MDRGRGLRSGLRADGCGATIAGRYATLMDIQPDDAPTVSYTEGVAFDRCMQWCIRAMWPSNCQNITCHAFELILAARMALGPGSTSVQYNSVLLIPDLLSDAECACLIDDVERCHALGPGGEGSPVIGRSESVGHPIDPSVRDSMRHSYGIEPVRGATFDAPANGFSRYRITTHAVHAHAHTGGLTGV